MTVGELLKRISSHEIEEWKQFFAIERRKQDRAEMDQRAVQGLEKRRTMQGR